MGSLSGEDIALLFLIVRKFKPANVIETGVAQGASSYAILESLRLNGRGKLTSIDLPNFNPAGFSYKDGTFDTTYVSSDLGTGWLIPQSLKDRWTLVLGKSAELLPMMNQQADLFFHDSEHSYENMMFEYKWAYNHLSPRGVIASDDIHLNEAYEDFKREVRDMRSILRPEKHSFGVLVKQ